MAHKQNENSSFTSRLHPSTTEAKARSSQTPVNTGANNLYPCRHDRHTSCTLLTDMFNRLLSTLKSLTYHHQLASLSIHPLLTIHRFMSNNKMSNNKSRICIDRRCAGTVALTLRVVPHPFRRPLSELVRLDHLVFVLEELLTRHAH